MNTFSVDNKPVVILFSSSGGLSFSVVEQLLDNQCRVVVVTADLEVWNKKTEGLKYNTNLQIFNIKSDYTENISGNYIIFISDSVEHSEVFQSGLDRDIASIALRLSNKLSISSLFIFPYTIFPDVDQELIQSIHKLIRESSDLVGMLFLGDLVGPRINFSESRLLQRIIKDIAHGVDVRLPSSNFSIYPITLDYAARQIIKRLFSFGGMGESVALLSPEIDAVSLASHLKNTKPDLSVIYTDENFNYKKFKKISSKDVLSVNIEEILKGVVDWYSPKFSEVKTEPDLVKRPQEKVITFKIPEVPGIKFTRPKINLRIKKRLAVGLGLLIFLVMSPYILLGAGGALALVTKNQAQEGNLVAASRSNSVSKIMFDFSRRELAIFARTPLIGGVFEQGESLVNFSFNATGIVERGFEAVNLVDQMVDRVLGKGNLDSIYLARELALEIDTIYKDLSFLESEVADSRGAVGYFANKFLGEVSLKEIRRKIMYAHAIAEDLPTILGGSEKKTYLVLFQNNMELRPTGGFIGSFALVTFEGGKLVDMDVLDVYDADGQLKGYVEPPQPLRKYLGEAVWYLRDSNWDPNFASSAQTAEWFLDKEIDTKVDGVVAVDLEFAKNLVDVFGSINLKDFNLELTSKNLYEVTQREVEDDFFPGSRKKSNFLTTLAQELLTRITNIKENEHLAISKVVLSSLDERHIQIFLHESRVQRAIGVLGWDGTITVPACSSNCYDDYLALVEANLGVNKANYYVTRQANMSIKLDKDSIERVLSVDILNSASASLGSNMRYKVYLRAIIPKDSELLGVEVNDGTRVQRVAPDIADVGGKKEAGVLIEVYPQKRTSVIFRWKTNKVLDFDNAGNYKLFWRKQAGTGADPIFVNIQPPPLTNIEASSYNTTLKKDFSASLTW